MFRCRPLLTLLIFVQKVRDRLIQMVTKRLIMYLLSQIAGKFLNDGRLIAAALRMQVR